MPNPETNEGWEQRYEAVKDAVVVSIHPGKILDALISQDLITYPEYERAMWKITLIEPFVTRMVVNMLKGTVKYPSDDWPAETWQDMGLDDKVDGINYELLLHHHLHQEGKL